MNEISNDVLGLILSYCDSHKDYCSWALVSKQWKSKIELGIKNVLNTTLSKDINRMVGNHWFQRIYLSNNPVNQYTITPPTNYFNTLFFYCWGPSFDVSLRQIDFFEGTELVHRMTGHREWTLDHAYWYGSKLPSNDGVGYVCVKAIGKIDKIVITFNHFTPILIAVNYHNLIQSQNIII